MDREFRAFMSKGVVFRGVLCSSIPRQGRPWTEFMEGGGYSFLFVFCTIRNIIIIIKCVKTVILKFSFMKNTTKITIFETDHYV